VFHNTTPDLQNQDQDQDHSVQDQNQDRIFWSETGLALRPTVSDHITDVISKSRQLRFHGHLLRSDRALYALYEPKHGKTRRGRPRTNYINYTQKVTGHQLPELTELSQNQETWSQLVVE